MACNDTYCHAYAHVLDCVQVRVQLNSDVNVSFQVPIYSLFINSKTLTLKCEWLIWVSVLVHRGRGVDGLNTIRKTMKNSSRRWQMTWESIDQIAYTYMFWMFLWKPAFFLATFLNGFFPYPFWTLGFFPLASPKISNWVLLIAEELIENKPIYVNHSLFRYRVYWF